MTSTLPRDRLFTPILIGGCIIILISFAIRASFGVFQIPVAEEFGWPRSYFSLAIAIQNLAWGIGQPVFGAIAERWGDKRAIVIGALFYAAGLVLTAWASTPGTIQLLEVLVGFGIAGTGFGVILAVVGRSASDDNRSLALGVVTAAGSAGQIIGAPIAELLLAQFPWQTVFIIFAMAILCALFALPLIRTPERASTEVDEPMGRVLARAVKDPSYILIFLGFFSCGYQLGFITAHFPAFVTELCAPITAGSWLASIGITTTSALGALAIAVIGLMNVGGTILAGMLGKTHSKKYLLAGIYLARTVVSAAFIMAPVTPGSVLLFSAAMGSLWLATVPLTSGLVAQIFGLRYMGTLYGLVFFSHQLGSFMGVWLGGALYDMYGNYTLVWWIGVGIGAFSALVHLPVNERPYAMRGVAA
ncbi:MFS transporter [Haematobacter massiliensis]|uniref:MFS transporter n=1 Tax=Haematobacter massiliensis TaxID=195105 RepID=A0A086XZC6_9RHOB|nr:MFS transporter [Haematobacter massiliensis]KFI27376.1 MFS transporter [Haematobacter massiliensis]OWJ70793.1 MFS transporter [Haematobacter massiliensis]OWJ84883.1 MFS transporter [Haematobacter massiliensis]QBJ23822.1 MFS transporter [Haematobacter massiliensis]